jgi:hypothetical protein
LHDYRDRQQGIAYGLTCCPQFETALTRSDQFGPGFFVRRSAGACGPLPSRSALPSLAADLQRRASRSEFSRAADLSQQQQAPRGPLRCRLLLASADRDARPIFSRCRAALPSLRCCAAVSVRSARRCCRLLLLPCCGPLLLLPICRTDGQRVKRGPRSIAVGAAPSAALYRPRCCRSFPGILALLLPLSQFPNCPVNKILGPICCRGRWPASHAPPICRE